MEIGLKCINGKMKPGIETHALTFNTLVRAEPQICSELQAIIIKGEISSDPQLHDSITVPKVKTKFGKSIPVSKTSVNLVP